METDAPNGNASREPAVADPTGIAQDPDHLDHPLIATATLTCFACPEQWAGTLRDGRHFYFRYRYAWASLGLGPDEDSAVDDPDEVGVQHGDGLQGAFLSGDERSAVFGALLTQRTGKDTTHG